MYQPAPPPSGVDAYIYRELQKIANEINDGERRLIYLSVNNVLPDKPREGDVRNFAATVATASAGLHEYVGGAWSKL
jgi:hypothetical protein